MVTREKTQDKILYCECCGRNPLAVINDQGEIVITRRGHKLVIPGNAGGTTSQNKKS